MGRLCGIGTAAAPSAKTGAEALLAAASTGGGCPAGLAAATMVAAAERLTSLVATPPGPVTGCCCEVLKSWIPGRIAPHDPLHLQTLCTCSFHAVSLSRGFTVSAKSNNARQYWQERPKQ